MGILDCGIRKKEASNVSYGAMEESLRAKWLSLSERKKMLHDTRLC